MHFIDLVEHDEKKSILAPPSNMYGLARIIKGFKWVSSQARVALTDSPTFICSLGRGLLEYYSY